MTEPDSTSVRGRRVLITGGSSGIGLATAHELTAAGARVALLSRGGDALHAAAAKLHPSPFTVEADVADAAAVGDALDRAARELGGLDAVVANAGAATYGPFAETAVDDYRRTLDVTLLGAINTAHSALPHLERTGGTLVVVGSIAGRVPAPWLAAYTAAKHGLRGFTRALSVELAAMRSPVSVALVAPGPVDSPFWKHARTADGRLPPEIRGAYRPEEVASEILRAIRDPRGERTVGGAMAAWALVDALAPNLTRRLMGPVARIGWRNRSERPASTAPDALRVPAEAAQVDGDLRSRGSVARRLRDVVGLGQ